MEHFGRWHHRGSTVGGGSEDRDEWHLGAGGAARLRQWLEDAIAFVESFLGLTPPQAEAWRKLAGTLRVSAGSIEEACRGSMPC